MNYMPCVESMNRVAGAPLGDRHTVVLFDQIKSAGQVQYAFLVAVFENATQQPVYFIASEINMAGPLPETRISWESSTTKDTLIAVHRTTGVTRRSSSPRHCESRRKDSRRNGQRHNPPLEAGGISTGCAGRIIKLLTVQDILDEEHVQKM